MKRILMLVMAAFVLSGVSAAERYVGGDISLLPDYEKAGAQYRTETGTLIPDLLPWLHEQGMNSMRVRLFVNPGRYKELHASDADDATRYDPNACQDLEYIRPLCKRIVDNGMDLMLDFHYSDTWADPAHQWTPVDWEGLTDEELYQKIYDYTRGVLLELKADGIEPAFIQPGNEISYGMLWGPAGTDSPKKALMGSSANWERFGRLLNQAVRACREVCPRARIVIHTERTSDVAVQKNFYNQMARLGVDYDIIGLSYYPYFHGGMGVLESALQSLQTNFPDKAVMIVETGYSYAWEVPGSNYDHSSVWPYTQAGQEKFARDLVATLEKFGHVDGLYWWWLEYNAYRTSLSGWYNAPLFDSRDGKACPALKTICSYAGGSGVEMPPSRDADEGGWYGLDGRRYGPQPALPGVYVKGNRKIVVGR